MTRILGTLGLTRWVSTKGLYGFACGLRIAATRSRSRLLSAVSDDELVGSLIIIDNNKIRIRTSNLTKVRL